MVHHGKWPYLVRYEGDLFHIPTVPVNHQSIPEFKSSPLFYSWGIIRLQGETNSKHVRFFLMDILGNELDAQKALNTNNGWEAVMNIRPTSTGIYIIKAISSNDIIRRKILIRR